MTPGWNELPIALDKLDDHIKALLRLKIREFVHLSPWFKNVPAMDAVTHNRSESSTMPQRASQMPTACPHRKHDGRVGRRIVRGSLHLNGLA